MIKNFSLQKNNSVQSILNFLQSSDYYFYLTGSRFFGNPKPDSDWDFFCGMSISIERYLSNLGFKKISDEQITDLGYDRTQFSTIMQYNCSDGVIQIQLIQNVSAKERVQNLLKEDVSLGFNDITKEKKKKLWSLFLKMAGQY